MEWQYVLSIQTVHLVSKNQMLRQPGRSIEWFCMAPFGCGGTRKRPAKFFWRCAWFGIQSINQSAKLNWILITFQVEIVALMPCVYSDPALRSKKAVLISGTFHRINIPAGWKLKASVSMVGVGTTSRKKQTCHCACVKYMTKRRQEGKAGLLFISFAWIWNSAFWVMFWRNLGLLLLFWKSFN